MKKMNRTVRDIIINLIVYNGLIVMLLAANKGGRLNPPVIFMIILLVFLIPGISWIGLFKDVNKKGFLITFFLSIFMSTLIMLFGNLLLVLLKAGSQRVLYLIYIMIVINAGVLITGRRHNALSLINSRKMGKYLPYIFIFMVIFIFVYLLAAYYIPPLPDNTMTIQGTAYGLINYFRPYILNDDGMCIYDFGHPLLLNFYGANAILLSGHLKELKYYYDCSQAAKKVQEDGPIAGDTFFIYISRDELLKTRILSIEGDLLVLDKEVPFAYLSRAYPNYKNLLLKDASLKIKHLSGDSILVENRSKNKNTITRTLYEQIMLRQLLKIEYERFYENPHLLCTRIVNIFFFITTVILIFIILLKLNLVSPPIALLLCVLYVSFPEVTIRSVGGSYTAISNFFLVSMLYFYLIENKNKKISFLCAVFGGLSSHKLVFVPLAIMIKRFFNKHKHLLLKELTYGFLFGLLVYWVYGLSINPKLFLIDHFQHHFINRVLHISQLGYTNYPNFCDYWGTFIANLGWPVFFIGIVSLLILLKKSKEILHILPVLFFTGAIIFSIIDWKETKHLMLIVAPLVFGIAHLLNMLSSPKNKFRTLVKINVLCILLVTIICNFYLFAAYNGYQMLDKLQIFH